MATTRDIHRRFNAVGRQRSGSASSDFGDSPVLSTRIRSALIILSASIGLTGCAGLYGPGYGAYGSPYYGAGYGNGSPYYGSGYGYGNNAYYCMKNS